jgi:hypothetical protein
MPNQFISVVLGTLPDGRLQLWGVQPVSPGSGNSTTWSKWKLTDDPNSAWTNWNQLPEDYDDFSILTAPMGPDGRLMLFGIGPDTNVISWRLKASIDPSAEWLPWQPFEPQFLSIFSCFSGAVLGGQMMPYYLNTPIELWVVQSDSGAVLTLVNSYALSAISAPVSYFGGDWLVFPSQLGDFASLVWALYCQGSAVNTFPIWALGLNGTLYWNTAELNYLGPEGNLSSGPKWGQWQQFVQLPNGAELTSLAAGQLPDGRVQVFASDSNGFLYSIWQQTGGVWPASWQPFPQPGGNAVQVNNGSSIFWPNGSFQNQFLVIGNLPDGRLQLFALDASGTAWSTWKETTDPNSPWFLPWSVF